VTADEQKEIDRQSRLAGQRIIEEQARQEVRTFLDQLRNGARLYQTVTRLGEEVAKEYRGRAVMELLQNAYDVLGLAGDDDPRRVSFVLNSSPEQAELLVANSGRPFRRKDLNGICQLAQSTKRLNKSVGNKGLGFRSVHELTTCPEIWSTAPAGGDVAFTFGFDPDVLGAIARVAKQLFDRDAPTDPAFGPEPVVDWSDNQIDEYRGRLSEKGKTAEEVKEWLSGEIREYLSPYGLPRFLGDPPVQVAKLLEDGHVTVIRLPLDGGKTGDSATAIESVEKQLKALDAAAIAFLHDLSALSISINGKSVERTRSVDSDLPFPAPSVRRDRVTVRRTGTDTSDGTERSFHVWSRTVGGADQPKASKRIAEKVRRHLPDRRHEVRTVEVAVAVEETTTAPPEGLYFISLPTETHTTVGAHINAPFYGSLDRRHIYFEDAYNELLLEFVKELLRDVVEGLVAGDREPWRGRAVIDLLAPLSDSPDANPDSPEAKKKGPRLAGTLRELRFANERHLDDQSLILCDDGWSHPGVARTMPNIPADDPVGEAHWRAQAGFAVVSSALDERREAVEALLRALGGSPDPTEAEWADTLAGMAGWVRASQPEPTWDDFLRSMLAVLPRELTSEPAKPDADPLREARFLPASDGGLCAGADDVRVFFRPRRGDEAAGFVDSIPDSLTAGDDRRVREGRRIAFLHSGVKTLVVDGKKNLNTPVQKFLDGRFVRSFRREDILRAVIDLSPKLPVAHGSAEAMECAEILRWTLKLVGEEEQEGLLPLLGRLPVACIGGWFAMNDAVFGPGWRRSGDHLKTLADCLPEQEGQRLLLTALLPLGDSRWNGGEAEPANDPETGTIEETARGDIFARAGVAEGLRLEKIEPPMCFWMDHAHRDLPGEAPERIPQGSWDHWRDSVRPQIDLGFVDWHEYEIGFSLLPVRDLLHREDLSDSARRAVAELILTSMAHWEVGWDKVTIRKKKGRSWSQRINSPLKHWLSTLPWLDDHSGKEHAPQREPQPLHQRWLVPESLLRWLKGHFRHLSPLSLELAQRLAEDEELLETLAGCRRDPLADRGNGLGLNVYPTEDAWTGPALLEALAGVAKAGQPMPAGGFDVFLGQIRHAWRHFGPDRELPKEFVVRTKPRMFEVRIASELKEVYLPDDSANTRSLRDQEQPILAIRPAEANGRVGDRLHELGARRASALDERCLIDGLRDADAKEGAQPLDATTLGWLPVVLLALHAHGGGNPRGPATAAWRDAAKRLGEVSIRRCGSIRVELVYSERIVATSEPTAHWIAQDRILLLHRDILQRGLYEEIAAASQAILDRQDLLKDLRLVLGSLVGESHPARDQIDKALERAEIDSEAVADIRLKWLGQTAMLVHRIRPVVKLLNVSDAGLDAATDTIQLTEWLSDKDLKWPSEDLLATARRCNDDFEMGLAAWRKLGDDAELRKWNKALLMLGEEYPQVENKYARDEAERHLEGVVRLLRAFARHVATHDGNLGEEANRAELFSEVIGVHEAFEMDAEWSRLWWEVPFRAVLDALLEGYARIPAVEPAQLAAFRNATTIEELVSGLKEQGVTLEPDPLKMARENHSRVVAAVRSVWELQEAWRRTKEADWHLRKAPRIVLDAAMHLGPWSDGEVLIRAKDAFVSQEFLNAVNGCATIDEMRRRLCVSMEALKRIRKEHRRQTHEEAGKKKVVKIGEWDYEVDGPVGYDELFERLKQLHEPVGPRADRDEFTRLTDPPPIRVAPDRGSGEMTRQGKTIEHPPAYLPELVGIVGEMHAFRFLQSRFGESVFDENHWVSQFRTKVLSLRKGERGKASDSLGYDFRFRHDEKTWCVEVKATTEDGTSFDLTPGEVAAARRMAVGKDERWRILRVRRVLTKQPEYDWLPNPFEPGAGQRLRLRQGGMTVDYKPKDQ